MSENQCDHKDPAVNRCLFVAHTFPPIAAVGIYRTLRFMHHLPAFGWEGMVVAMEPDAANDHPVDHALCSRIPANAIVKRVGVWRPLDRFVEWLKAMRRSIRSAVGGDAVNNQQVTKSATSHLASDSETRSAPRTAIATIKDWLRSVRDVLFFTPDNCVNWVGPAVLAGCRLVRQHRPKVIISSGPPHSAHLAGLGIHWLTRVPLILDLRDPWASDEWLGTEDYRIRMWMQKKIERICVRFAASVILNTERLRQNFIDNYPRRWAHKFVAIPNGVDDQIIKPVADYLSVAPPRRDDAALTLCHPGSIYWHRSLMPMIEAIRHLKQSGAQIQFEQIGLVDHPPDLAERLIKWELPEVHLRGRLSHEETLKQMAKSDVLVVIQPMSTLQVPAKLYEMLIFKKPILVITKDGATADVIKDFGIGFIADPMDPLKIADAIRSLDSQVKCRSIQGDWDRAIHAFDSQNLTSRLVNVMTKVTN